ncbi:hypothetical protein [Tellurirhabdus bombi]|uniref:hypothetical protein n=1 Tax=Tellurirhabdus bombi TaxID=2907205 RepID=UPI001F280809|nr:hypothetical protein [Tellurirhabdus bombi]
MEIDLILPELHEAQQYIVDNALRFNALRCGRRFGKSDLAKDLLIETALDHSMSAAYFNATYKLMAQFWDEFNDMIEPIRTDKDEQQKTIWLLGGGRIDFWSLQDKNAGRGRKYKRVIVDEAAMADDLETAWTQCIRPTLTDFKGDAFFMSTPKGRQNYFYKLCQNGGMKPGWKEFHYKTVANPYIDPAEVLDAKNDLDLLTFQQEYEAEFVELAGNLYFKIKEAVNLKTGTVFDPKQPVYVSMDFNKVNSVTIRQKQNGALVYLEEIHQGGDEEDLEAICKQLATRFGRYLIMFTGDASGNSASAYTTGNKSAWSLIKGYMAKYGANFCDYMAVPLSNPSTASSRFICNSLIKHYGAKLIIDRDKCPILASDVVRMKTASDGGLDKPDCDKYDYGHIGDCFRYDLVNFEYTTFKEISKTAW